MLFEKAFSKFRLVVLFGVASLLMFTAACASEPVSLVTSLAEKPEAYEGKRVKVYGWLVEKVGEKSYFLYEPYYGYCPQTGKIEICFHFVEVKTFTWIFLDGEGSSIVVAIEEKATGSLPLLVVPAFASSYDSEEMVLLTGKWWKSEDGYILIIEKVDRLDEG